MNPLTNEQRWQNIKFHENTKTAELQKRKLLKIKPLLIHL